MMDQTRQKKIFDSAYECAQISSVLVHGERSSTYGPVIDNFSRTARALNIAWNELGKFTILDVASINIAIKLARILKTIDHKDSWIDICGYACCGYVCSSSATEDSVAKADFYEFLLTGMRYDISNDELMMNFIEKPDETFDDVYNKLTSLNKKGRYGDKNSWIRIGMISCVCYGVFCS